MKGGLRKTHGANVLSASKFTITKKGSFGWQEWWCKNFTPVLETPLDQTTRAFNFRLLEVLFKLVKKKYDYIVIKTLKAQVFKCLKLSLYFPPMFLIVRFSVLFTYSPSIDLIYKDFSFHKIYHESLKFVVSAKTL